MTRLHTHSQREKFSPGFSLGVERLLQSLRHNVMHNVAGDVGQPEIAAAVAIRQSLVIHSQQMQDRGVQIVDADAILDRFVAGLVGFATRDSATNTSARHPNRVCLTHWCQPAIVSGMYVQAEILGQKAAKPATVSWGAVVRQNNGDSRILSPILLSPFFCR